MWALDAWWSATRHVPGIGFGPQPGHGRTDDGRTPCRTSACRSRRCIVIDPHYSDPGLARLYDPLTGPENRADFGFYLPLVLQAHSVLDVGCGTGALLHQARRAGHAGRLVGLDPAEAMLDCAQARSDIEWILGDLSGVTPTEQFDLVVMTGHAFQVFVDDDQLISSLARIGSILTRGGQFAFETRNPGAREWEQWTPDRVVTFVDDAGVVIHRRTEVDAVDGDRVRFTQTFTSPSWDESRTSQSTLRFVDVRSLSASLARAGFVIEEAFGNWDGSPLVSTSPEIIVVAGRSG